MLVFINKTNLIINISFTNSRLLIIQYVFKIDIYLVNNFSGKVLNNFHKELKWIEIKDIREYDFLEGDLKIINHISSNDFKY